MSLIFPEWRQRLEVCRSCQHAQHHLKGNVTSCGELIVGSTVEVDGEKIQLCGCVMELKTKLPLATCPVNKWSDIET